MRYHVSERITDSLVEAGAVATDDRALYEYGIRLGILMVINIATGLVIGLLLGMFLQSMIFLIVYKYVRSYAGGYHANNQLTCYLLSIPVMFAVLYGIRYIPWNDNVLFIVLITAAMVLFFIDAGEDKNKPLDDLEKVVYKKRARVYTATFSGIAVMLWFAGMQQSALSVAMALGVSAIMLVLGALKNRRLNVEKA
jgi:accessory gene regulator B